MRILSKLQTAHLVWSRSGLSGLYETAMYRYFWPIGARLLSPSAKRWEELRYWRRQARDGALDNSWYDHLFTVPFGLTVSDYAGKRVLDIGCGPRGTLEWAVDALERVGLDPLVSRYRGLGIAAHSMTYVEARSEAIPYADARFDYVTCINALDHVDDVRLSLGEMARVLRSGGSLLVIVDVGHEPTLSEPHCLSWEVLGQVSGFETLRLKKFKRRGGAAQSVYAGVELGDNDRVGREGALLAMLRKN